MHTRTLRPRITIAQTEYQKLFTLTATAGGSMSSAAESLLMELERARVLVDHKMPSDVVRIGSHIQYRTERDEVRDVTLVYPHEADISQGRVSVLTPVGAALIGLQTGQSMTWESRDGRRHVMTVQSASRLSHPATA